MIYHIFRCSRCGTEARKAWSKLAYPCIIEGCPGVMRRVNLLRERKDARAKRDLAAYEVRA